MTLSQMTLNVDIYIANLVKFSVAVKSSIASAECYYAEYLFAESCSGKSRYAECHCAEHRYARFCCAEFC